MIYHTKNPFMLWMLCHDCGFEWRAEFVIEFGSPVNLDSAGEECIECSSNNIESTTGPVIG